MEKDSITKMTTVGIGGFGNSGNIGGQEPLFRVVAGHPMDYAAEQSSTLMTCAHALTDAALTQEAKQLPMFLTAAHYLTGMAKALSQDVSHVMMEASRE